jgi:genome maintenance exonuclease 1
MKLAGTCDLIISVDGILTVVDYKTSSKPKRREWVQHYILQCAAYALMINERTGLRVPQVAILIAVEGQTEPTIFCEKTRDHMVDLYKVLKTYGALSS